MITLSVMMFCAQVAFNILVEEMRWYWAVYSAVVIYSLVVVLLAVLANVDTIFPQILLKV
jgi:hypothetical protein|tara:strand:+ start:379 stop:558 length:180 start_codon:yes stop_codon:yes gene_type:complete